MEVGTTVRVFTVPHLRVLSLLILDDPPFAQPPPLWARIRSLLPAPRSRSASALEHLDAPLESLDALFQPLRLRLLLRLHDLLYPLALGFLIFVRVPLLAAGLLVFGLLVGKQSLDKE